MTLKEFLKSLDDLEYVDQAKQLAFIKSKLIQIDDPADREIAESVVDNLLSGGNAEERSTVVISIHGIRTEGIWQDQLTQALDKLPDIKAVYPVKYSYFDAIRFWFPVLFRKGPIKKVWSQLQSIRAENPNNDVIIIAHSFGTYITAKILKSEPHFKIHRLLFCGAIVSEDFKWHEMPNFPTESAINDCGTRDIWPILAKTTTWGYGTSGAFGFESHKINDRFHDCGHGGFFNMDFYEKYWIPFITTGQIIPSDWTANRPTAPMWKQLVSLAPGLLLMILVAIVSIFLINFL